MGGEEGELSVGQDEEKNLLGREGCGKKELSSN